MAKGIRISGRSPGSRGWPAPISSSARSHRRAGLRENPVRVNHSSPVVPKRANPKRQRWSLGSRSAQTVRGLPRAISRRRVNTAPRTATTMNRAPPTSTSLVSSSSCTSASGADLGGVDGLGNDGDPVVFDREEAAVDRCRVALPGRGLDADFAADQNPQQRRVTRQDPELALDGACTDLLGLALPDLAICGDELDVQLTHGSSAHERVCRVYPAATGARSPRSGTGPTATPTPLLTSGRSRRSDLAQKPA